MRRSGSTSHFVSEGLANKGKEFPFAPYKTRKINVIKLLLKEKEMYLITINGDKDIKEEHIIPVENIKAPVLLLSAVNDMVWPSYDSALYMEKRLQEHNFPYPLKHVAFPTMNHGMLTELNGVYKIMFKTERRNKEKCAEEREQLKKELLSWVDDVWK